MFKQPALAPSPQPRPAPTTRALPAEHADQRGPFWMPIGGPSRTPIDKQESLIAEFIAMKFKLVRSSTASELLRGAEFRACPACGTDVAGRSDVAHCVLCKSDLDKAPGGFE